MPYLVWGTMEKPEGEGYSCYESAYECEDLAEAQQVAQKMFKAAMAAVKLTPATDKRVCQVQVDIYADQPPHPLWLLRVKLKAKAKWNCWRKATIHGDPMPADAATS